jgi:hypothetical protein
VERKNKLKGGRKETKDKVAVVAVGRRKIGKKG